MKNIKKITEVLFSKKQKNMKQRLLAAMMAIVVFCTTYSLVLPAITLDSQTAETEPGIEAETAAEETLGEVQEEDLLLAGQNAEEDETVAVAPETEEIADIPAETEEVTSDPETETAAPVLETEADESEKETETETEEVYAKSPLIYHCDKYDIELSFDSEDWQLPEGTILSVKELNKEADKDSEEYQDYHYYDDRAKEEISDQDEELAERAHALHFYELLLKADGEEISIPEGAADITIKYNSDSEAIGDEDTILASLFWLADWHTLLFDKNHDNSDVFTLKDHHLKKIYIKDLELSDFDNVIGLYACPPEKKVTLKAEGSDYSVTAVCGQKSGVPEDAKLSVSEIKPGSKAFEQYLDSAREALGEEKENNVPAEHARFFDIKIMVEGKEFTPEAEIDVKIDFQDPVVIEQMQDVSAVHFGDEGTEVLDVTTEESKEGIENVSFTADSFSVYGVVYTVDFHWEVDGKIYDFSIPGGGFVSFTELIEALGLTDDTDNAKKFVEDVDSVEFSTPELVWVGKADADTTVGELKEANKLECEYSAELTEEQIENINNTTVESGDWALISMQSFESEESLSVTMKDGEVFTIRITDAQISKDFITAKGETYTITVIYDSDAEIPDGADLHVREIEAGTEAYQEYLTDAAEELGLENAGEVSFARFFDIEIVDKDGKKIEPKAPAQVKIAYKNAMEVGLGDVLSVVHFGEKKTEVITDLNVSDDAKAITYEQGSFSVTGTVVTPQNNGSNYMVLIKDEIEGSPVTFIVNNDGTLSLVKAEYNADGSVKSVEVDEPMTWTYKNSHLYHPYDAVAYNLDKAGSAFAYRYMNPSASFGLTTETINDITFDGTDQQSGRTASDSAAARRYWNSTTISYDSNNHALKNGNNYLGVGTNSDGSIAIIGNVSSLSDAAEVYFASPNKVTRPGAPNSGVTASQNVVNHIDISVSGTSTVDIPLAFGDYYSEGDLENPILSVSSNNQVTLEASSPVNIDLDDMKRAVITAYQKDNDGSIVYLDDAFYITGYSQNEATEIGDKAPQVRIEGAFKTAKAMHGESDNWLNTRASNGRYENRLASRVYYTVSVSKQVTFIPKYNGQDLYDAMGNRIEITLEITMTASFDYWDERNNCPPVTNKLTYRGNHWSNGGNVAEWRRGGYPNVNVQTYDNNGYNINGDFADVSGMDFILGGNAEEANSNIVAIEITKMIMNQDGTLINPVNQISQSFEVWGSPTDDHKNVITADVPQYNGDNDTYDRSTYSYLHSKEMKVGSSGMGLVYDYEITPGMYYIREDPSKIPQEIEDQDGTIWQYKETRIETEYVWRNNDTTGRHVSAAYSDLTSTDTNSYISIPEVAGNYTGKHYHNAEGYPESTDYNSSVFYGWNEDHTQLVDNQQFRNGFLEFFVYNVYEKVVSETDITLKKVDKNDLNENSPNPLKGASFTISKYDETFQSIDTDWGDEGSKTLSDIMNLDGVYPLNGVFTFEGLTEGYYKIEETDFPAGYVKLSSDPTFKVERNSSNKMEITLINNPDNLLRLEDNKLTIVVGNTPGASLPNTGGSGTQLFMILGSILILGAGLLLWRRRSII